MKKAEFIARRGEEAYAKMLAQGRAWKEGHPEEMKESWRKWGDAHREALQKYRDAHQEEIKAYGREQCQKGGKRYNKYLIYKQTGLQGARNIVRNKHSRRWRKYKTIVAPDSQLHHEWVSETSDYRGLAIVEADQHMHGFIDVIEVLEGKITLLSEKDVRTEPRFNGNYN